MTDGDRLCTIAYTALAKRREVKIDDSRNKPVTVDSDSTSATVNDRLLSRERSRNNNYSRSRLFHYYHYQFITDVR